MEILKIHNNPERAEWAALTERFTREEEEITRQVTEILADVKSGGDRSLREVTRRVEGRDPRTFEIPADVRAAAAALIPAALKEALAAAKANIETFHRAQLPPEVDIETMPGVRCVQRAVPIRRVGLYIPGGKAPLFSTVLMSLITKLLLPLVYGYIAACVAYAAVGNEGLKRIAGTLKWVVTSILTVVLLVFVGYLTVSGVIAGSTDAVTVKAAKFTMSSLVPVVGGILSDAAETVLAGAGILKNAVGVFGMLAVLCMCVAPFLQLGIHYLTYKVTSALSATVSSGRVAGLIDQIGGAFGLVLGMTGASALLLLISMVSAITAVVR